MPLSALTGTRIRETRTRLRMRQAELAKKVGVSGSYLNLIEHNRRRIAPDLLQRVAQVLGVSEDHLSGGVAEGDLIHDLRAMAAQADAEGIERVEEFAGRFPGWAQLAARHHARIVSLERTIETLSDRMTHDPHLSAALHEMLSAAASVRSTAAILSEAEDIAPDWRKRFEQNLAEDSARLAQGAETLVGFLDGQAAQETGIAAPLEEVEGWLARHDWHFASVEAGEAGEDLIAGAPELASQAAQALAQDYLAIYRRDAARLPLASLQTALARIGPDPGKIAQSLGVSPALVIRRLAVLPGNGAQAFGMVACDGSGTLIFRRPLPGFTLPRFGAACPLWPLYQALSHPGRPIKAAVRFAGEVGQSFSTWAICQPAWPDGYDQPPLLRSYMLIRPGGDTDRTQEIGTSCRICPRNPCSARREPPIISQGSGKSG